MGTLRRNSRESSAKHVPKTAEKIPSRPPLKRRGKTIRAPDSAYGYHLEKQKAKAAIRERRAAAEKEVAGARRGKKKKVRVPRVLRPLSTMELATRARKRWKDM